VHIETSFQEAAAELRLRSLPLSHLSIELGHLYFEDLDEGPARLRRHFELVAPWVAAAREILSPAPATPRISTCFLVDDYFGPSRPPAKVVPDLVAAATASGLHIDYLVRESGCAEADGVALADLVLERIVVDPPPNTNGSRPPLRDTGWLSNGQRSPATHHVEAMAGATSWQPPAQNAANRHSIFVDVELWDQHRKARRWSCAFLAAVWQLLRLGLLRHAGEPVAQPRAWEGEYPNEWSRLPAVLKLRDGAAPFSAYRALSVLDSRFLPTEHAVRTILSQVAIDPALSREAAQRAGAEQVALPLEAVDRVQYIFNG
jgi:hypothetical protein